MLYGNSSRTRCDKRTKFILQLYILQTNLIHYILDHTFCVKSISNQLISTCVCVLLLRLLLLFLLHLLLLLCALCVNLIGLNLFYVTRALSFYHLHSLILDNSVVSCLGKERPFYFSSLRLSVCL